MLPRGQLRKSPGKGTFPVLHCEKEASVKFRNNVCLCMLFLTQEIIFCFVCYLFSPLFSYFWVVNFVFFALLNIVLPGLCKFPVFFYTLGPLEKRSHSQAVWGGKWGERGLWGMKLEQRQRPESAGTYSRTLEFPVARVHIFVCFTFVAKNPALVPSCVLQRQSLFRRKPVLWPWPQATMVACQ